MIKPSIAVLSLGDCLNSPSLIQFIGKWCLVIISYWYMSSKFRSGGFEEIKTYKKFLAYIIMFQNVNKKTACTITIN